MRLEAPCQRGTRPRGFPAGSMYLTDRELEEVDKVAEKYGVSRGTAIKLIIKGLDLG